MNHPPTFVPELATIGCTGASFVKGLRIDDGFFRSDCYCLDATPWIALGGSIAHTSAADASRVYELCAQTRP